MTIQEKLYDKAMIDALPDEEELALAFIDDCRTVAGRPGHVVDASALCVDVALNGAAIGTDLMRCQADPAAPVPGRHKLTRPQATAGSFCVRFVGNLVQRVTAVR